jgi:hypothetical protein
MIVRFLLGLVHIESILRNSPIIVRILKVRPLNFFVGGIVCCLKLFLYLFVSTQSRFPLSYESCKVDFLWKLLYKSFCSLQT